MKYNGKNLKEVLVAHSRWLADLGRDCEDETYSSLADFSGTSLQDLDFRRKLLDHANFYGATIVNCDFSGCSLHGANFAAARLEKVNLTNARLSTANLMDAFITGCTFSEANLSGAVLYSAELRYSNFLHAEFMNTCFQFCSARGLQNMPYVPMVCPEEGSFIAWKAGFLLHHKSITSFGINTTEPALVKLMIPADAKRSSAFGRKCRASKAKVLDIYHLDGTKCLKGAVVQSSWDSDFTYHVGDVVEPEEPFDEDRWAECASGIHFFMNRQEAIDYIRR